MVEEAKRSDEIGILKRFKGVVADVWERWGEAEATIFGEAGAVEEYFESEEWKKREAEINKEIIEEKVGRLVGPAKAIAALMLIATGVLAYRKKFSTALFGFSAGFTLDFIIHLANAELMKKGNKPVGFMTIPGTSLCLEDATVIGVGLLLATKFGYKFLAGWLFGQIFASRIFVSWATYQM